jgi:hypothetical protein
MSTDRDEHQTADAPRDPSIRDAPGSGDPLAGVSTAARVLLALAIAVPVLAVSLAVPFVVNDAPTVWDVARVVLAGALIVAAVLLAPKVRALLAKFHRPWIAGTIEAAAVVALYITVLWLGVPATLSASFVPLFLVLWLPNLAYGCYHHHLMLDTANAASVACGKCGYERPVERTPINERCPECGNYWWLAPLAVFKWQRGSRHGAVRHDTPEARARRRKRLVPFTGVYVAAVVLFFAWLFGAVQPHMPTQVLVLLGRAGLETAASEALSRSLTTAQADALLRAAIEDRADGDDLGFHLSRALETAIPAGMFTPALVDRFFGDSVELTLTTPGPNEQGELPFNLHARILDATIWLAPDAAFAGVRINDGPWQQPVKNNQSLATTLTVEHLAHTFEDFSTMRLSGPLTDRTFRLPTPLGPALLPPDLPPSEHTLTLRLKLVSYSQQTKSTPGAIASTHFDAQGNPIPDPNAVWEETRDLTATFVVP